MIALEPAGLLGPILPGVCGGPKARLCLRLRVASEGLEEELTSPSGLWAESPLTPGSPALSRPPSLAHCHRTLSAPGLKTPGTLTEVVLHGFLILAPPGMEGRQQQMAEAERREVSLTHLILLSQCCPPDLFPTPFRQQLWLDSSQDPLGPVGGDHFPWGQPSWLPVSEPPGETVL